MLWSGNQLGSRDKAHFQVHFGADYSASTYGWTTNLDVIKRSVDWQLHALRTDYIDFGFIHCIDETEDLQRVEKAGIIRYIQEVKDKGVVRHIDLSSHTPSLADSALDMGILDMPMFSINSGYDYRKGFIKTPPCMSHAHCHDDLLRETTVQQL